MAPGVQYRFGPFHLDVEERELRRDGDVIALTAKTFDLLLILVRGAGRTFTKSELLESLWPNASVEESNLSQTIFLLRKALGENGDTGYYIRTVPRRGYKFIGSVSQQNASGNTVPSSPARDTNNSRIQLAGLWRAITVLAILALAALASFISGKPRPKRV